VPRPEDSACCAFAKSPRPCRSTCASSTQTAVSTSCTSIERNATPVLLLENHTLSSLSVLSLLNHRTSSLLPNNLNNPHNHRRRKQHPAKRKLASPDHDPSGLLSAYRVGACALELLFFPSSRDGLYTAQRRHGPAQRRYPHRGGLSSEGEDGGGEERGARDQLSSTSTTSITSITQQCTPPSRGAPRSSRSPRRSRPAAPRRRCARPRPARCGSLIRTSRAMICPSR